MPESGRSAAQWELSNLNTRNYCDKIHPESSPFGQKQLVRVVFGRVCLPLTKARCSNFDVLHTGISPISVYDIQCMMQYSFRNVSFIITMHGQRERRVEGPKGMIN